MSQSRYIHYDRRTLPKRKRRIPVWGAETHTIDQSGKLFRCWNCGFICNTDRDELGDGVGYRVIDEVEDGDGTAMGAHIGAAYRANFIALSIGTESDIYSFSLNSDGDPVMVEHNHTQQVSSGCPMCGCRQYA